MLSKINTDLADKLRNREYRQHFFRSRAQDEIASQLRDAREKRDLSQAQLAERCGMKQSAISRLEQASYSRWSFNTLMRIADALDLRPRIHFDYAEDVVEAYQQRERPQRQHQPTLVYVATHRPAVTRPNVWMMQFPATITAGAEHTPSYFLDSVDTIALGGTHAKKT